MTGPLDRCNSVAYSKIMNKAQTLITQLQDSGNRITPARGAIIDIFAKSSTPLTVELIRAALAKRKLPVNKTTVYREIEFLLGHGLIRVVRLDDSTKYYELISGHHHHVVCTNCGRFEDVETTAIEAYLTTLEKKLTKKIAFNSIKHSLEFFGECSACQKKKKTYV